MIFLNITTPPTVATGSTVAAIASSCITPVATATTARTLTTTSTSTSTVVVLSILIQEKNKYSYRQKNWPPLL